MSLRIMVREAMGFKIGWSNVQKLITRGIVDLEEGEFKNLFSKLQ